MAEEESYRLEFSNGTSIVAGAKHLWQTSCWPKSHQAGTKKLNALRTTRQISDTQDRYHEIAPLPVIEMFPAQLPVHPYVLGLWLGDGDQGNAAIHGALPDLEEIAVHVCGCGYECEITRRIAKGKSLTGSLLIRNLSKALWALGMENNKHVPLQYLRASKDQRLALVQGLLDTDGWVGSRNQVGWGQAEDHLGLVQSFSELLFTLGIKHRVGCYSRVNHPLNAQPFHQTQFASALPLFRLSRKAQRQWIAPAESRTQKLFIEHIVPVESLPLRCITVADPSGMFLAGKGFVPTHNSGLCGRG